eukprot:SAG11_NODE_28_length_23154_cov_11.023856_4_plen_2511_part_00
MALDTLFTFDASSDWTDVDVPLTYAFGYYQDSVGDVVIAPKAQKSSVAAQLPQGPEAAGYNLTVTCVVYDVYAASTRVSKVIVVGKFEVGDDLQNVASGKLAAAEDVGDITSAMTVVAGISGALAGVGSDAKPATDGGSVAYDECVGVVAPENGNLGDCPDDGTLGHGMSCTLVCEPGFTINGTQPLCEEGTLLSSAVCHQITADESIFSYQMIVTSLNVHGYTTEAQVQAAIAEIAGVELATVRVYTDASASTERRLLSSIMDPFLGRRMQADSTTFRVMISCEHEDVSAIEVTTSGMGHADIPEIQSSLTNLLNTSTNMLQPDRFVVSRVLSPDETGSTFYFKIRHLKANAEIGEESTESLTRRLVEMSSTANMTREDVFPDFDGFELTTDGGGCEAIAEVIRESLNSGRHTTELEAEGATVDRLTVTREPEVRAVTAVAIVVTDGFCSYDQAMGAMNLYACSPGAEASEAEAGETEAGVYADCEVEVEIRSIAEDQSASRIDVELISWGPIFGSFTSLLNDTAAIYAALNVTCSLDGRAAGEVRYDITDEVNLRHAMEMAHAEALAAETKVLGLMQAKAVKGDLINFMGRSMAKTAGVDESVGQANARRRRLAPGFGERRRLAALPRGERRRLAASTENCFDLCNATEYATDADAAPNCQANWGESCRCPKDCQCGICTCLAYESWCTCKGTATRPMSTPDTGEINGEPYSHTEYWRSECELVPVPAVPADTVMQISSVLYMVSAEPQQLQANSIDTGLGVVNMLIGSSATASAEEGRAMDPTPARMMLASSASYMSGTSLGLGNELAAEPATRRRRRLAEGVCYDECSCNTDTGACVCPVTCQCGDCNCPSYASICACANCTKVEPHESTHAAADSSSQIRGSLVDVGSVFSEGMTPGEGDLAQNTPIFAASVARPSRAQMCESNPEECNPDAGLCSDSTCRVDPETGDIYCDYTTEVACTQKGTWDHTNTTCSDPDSAPPVTCCTPDSDVAPELLSLFQEERGKSAPICESEDPGRGGPWIWTSCRDHLHPTSCVEDYSLRSGLASGPSRRRLQTAGGEANLPLSLFEEGESPPVTSVGWDESPYFWQEDPDPQGSVSTLVIPSTSLAESTVGISLTLPEIAEIDPTADPFVGMSPSQFDAADGDWVAATLYNPVTVCDPQNCPTNGQDVMMMYDTPGHAPHPGGPCTHSGPAFYTFETARESYQGEPELQDLVPGTCATNACCDPYGDGLYEATGGQIEISLPSGAKAKVCACCAVSSCTKMACSSKTRQGADMSPMEACQQNQLNKTFNASLVGSWSSVSCGERGVEYNECERWDVVFPPEGSPPPIKLDTADLGGDGVDAVVTFAPLGGMAGVPPVALPDFGDMGALLDFILQNPFVFLCVMVIYGTLIAVLSLGAYHDKKDHELIFEPASKKTVFVDNHDFRLRISAQDAPVVLKDKKQKKPPYRYMYKDVSPSWFETRAKVEKMEAEREANDGKISIEYGDSRTKHKHRADALLSDAALRLESTLVGVHSGSTEATKYIGSKATFWRWPRGPGAAGQAVGHKDWARGKKYRIDDFHGENPKALDETDDLTLDIKQGFFYQDLRRKPGKNKRCPPGQWQRETEVHPTRKEHAEWAKTMKDHERWEDYSIENSEHIEHEWIEGHTAVTDGADPELEPFTVKVQGKPAWVDLKNMVELSPSAVDNDNFTGENGKEEGGLERRIRRTHGECAVCRSTVGCACVTIKNEQLYELTAEIEYTDDTMNGGYMIGIFNGQTGQRLIWQTEYQKRYYTSIFRNTKALMDRLWSLQTGKDGKIMDNVMRTMKKEHFSMASQCTSDGREAKKLARKLENEALKQRAANMKRKTVSMYFVASWQPGERDENGRNIDMTRKIPIQIRIAAAGRTVRFHSVTLDKFTTVQKWRMKNHDEMFPLAKTKQAGKHQVQHKLTLWRHAQNAIFKEHKWLGIIHVHPHETFTRARRAGLLLTWFSLQLNLNALWYATKANDDAAAKAQGLEEAEPWNLQTQILVGLVSSLLPLPIIQTVTMTFERMTTKSFLRRMWLRFTWLLVTVTGVGGLYMSLMWGMAIAAIGGSDAANDWLITCVTGTGYSVFISQSISLLVSKALVPWLKDFLHHDADADDENMSPADKRKKKFVTCVSTFATALSFGLASDDIGAESGAGASRKKRKKRSRVDEKGRADAQRGWRELKNTVRLKMMTSAQARPEHLHRCLACSTVLNAPGRFTFQTTQDYKKHCSTVLHEQCQQSWERTGGAEEHREQMAGLDRELHLQANVEKKLELERAERVARLARERAEKEAQSQKLLSNAKKSSKVESKYMQKLREEKERQAASGGGSSGRRNSRRGSKAAAVPVPEEAEPADTTRASGGRGRGVVDEGEPVDFLTEIGETSSVYKSFSRRPARRKVAPSGARSATSSGRGRRRSPGRSAASESAAQLKAAKATAAIMGGERTDSAEAEDPVATAAAAAAAAGKVKLSLPKGATSGRDYMDSMWSTKRHKKKAPPKKK